MDGTRFQQDSHKALASHEFLVDDVITALLKDKSKEERGTSPWKTADGRWQERVDISLNSKVEL